MKVGLKRVLIQSRESHWGKVGNYWYVFLPLAPDGVVVVDETTKIIYDLVDGKRKAEDIYLEVRKMDKEARLEDLKKILTNLTNKGVIEIKGEERKNFVEKKPRIFEVWMHVTNQCNLRCKYCYVKKTDESMSEEMMLNMGMKVIKNAKKNGFIKVKFKMSGGESLLRFNKIIKFVVEIRKFAKKKNIKVDFVMMTNGVLLTREVTKKLKEMKIRAAISIDGLKKYHDLQRVFADGRGSFDLVIKGVDNLQKDEVKFNASVTITKYNVSNLADLSKFFLSKKIPFAFNFYRDIGVGKEMRAKDKDLIKCLSEAYTCIAKDMPKYRITNGLLDGVVIGRPHKNVCGMGKSYVAIGIDGRVFGCQMMIGEENGVYENNLMKAMKVNDFTDGKGVDSKKDCLRCKWRYVCGGGCPLLSKEKKGDWRAKSPYCGVYRAMLPKLVRLEAKRLIKWGVK